MTALLCSLNLDFGPLVTTTLVAQLVPNRVFDGCWFKVCPAGLKVKVKLAGSC
jgi:hypothetical protein